ncbi:hypothetical protein SteCoe_25334 [Stentor coeruleus]|uniref:RING-type domain-containing protein n=1 Tax=Stentor coeruleus TaxID=5963 RepID=A0A1R2BFF9_9CILI|nr:hypothetical protein SteCoe_25334 [Stentor coeruleus]
MSEINGLAQEPSENSIANRQAEERKLAEANRQEVITQIRIWYEYFLICAVFLLLLRISYSSPMPNFIPYAFLAAYELVWLIRVIIKHYRSQGRYISRCYVKDIFAIICNFIFYTLVSIYTADLGLFLVLTCIPLHICNIITFLVKFKYRSKCKNFASKSEACFRWAISLTVLFSGLKELNLIPWKWSYIFWPIWILVLVLILIGIAEIIFAGKIMYRSYKGRASCGDSICPIWMVYLSTGIAICIGYFFFELTIYLQNGQTNQILNAFLVILIYCIGLFVITFLFNSLIVSWFEKYFSSNQHIINSNHMFIPPINNIVLPPALIHIKEYPITMLKVSSTFFVSNHSEDQNEEDKSSIDVNDVHFNGSVDEGKVCTICCTNEADGIFMHCGHGGICFECACQMWKKTKKCHICRGVVEQIYKYRPLNHYEVEVVKAIRYSIIS